MLRVSKDYVNYMDNNFYTILFKERNKNYIYKTDNINKDYYIMKKYPK